MLPSEIQIGAATIAVLRPEQIQSDGVDCNGLYDDDKLTIQIVSSLCEDRAEQTFVHELLHAVGTFVGIEGKITEEEFCRRVSPALHAAMKTNGFWSIRPERQDRSTQG
jgi:hypothetical protein